MQGPRTKSEVELAWSKIKRAITAQVTFESQVWRERRLNELLDAAWREFTGALDRGEILGPKGEALELGDGS